MSRILLIDDDDQFRSMLAARLERMGHEVTTACDGRIGLQQFREQQPDLIISDLIMPQMEGLELIRELRGTPPVRIIAMSGGGRTSPTTYLQIAQRLGAVAVLEKPFSTDELTAAIRAALSAAV